MELLQEEPQWNIFKWNISAVQRSLISCEPIQIYVLYVLLTNIAFRQYPTAVFATQKFFFLRSNMEHIHPQP